MTISLSLAEARRLALASQGFGVRPKSVSADHIRGLASRLHAFQIDSVNVVARAHYVPAFARLGHYPMAALDALTYEKRDLFEYWGHAASLIPVSLYPLFRYRMHREHAEAYLRSEGGSYARGVLEEVRERGALGAGDLAEPRRKAGKWWAWGDGKTVLEYLFASGLLAIAGRRQFERLYDLTERVIPREVLDRPAPSSEDSMKELMYLSAQACGVGTLKDFAYYLHVDNWRDRMNPDRWFGDPATTPTRRSKPIAARLARELIDEGRLIPAEVESWTEAAYVVPGAKPPGSMHARAVVTPFDSLCWDRARLKRLFGMDYTIEIYTPAPKRIYGYYVMPFLLGDTFVGRLDLKSDRKTGTLVVQGAYVEPGHDADRIAPDLNEELSLMASWLGLERVEVLDRGELAPPLLAVQAGSGNSSR
jgi:uncharacterized protein YcaQ